MKNLSLMKKSLGQGMTEYIIIVALIAIAAIGVFRLFGDTARHQMAGMAQELGGNDGSDAIKNASDSAIAADKDEVTKRNLGNYAGNNSGGTSE
jgi:type IV pilus assembly protein PilA